MGHGTTAPARGQQLGSSDPPTIGQPPVCSHPRVRHGLRPADGGKPVDAQTIWAATRSKPAKHAAAAGFAIGAAHMSVLGISVAVVCFTALAGSTAAVPILAYLLWTHRVDRQLERFKSWMQRRQALITAVVLLLIGIVLLYNGIGAV